MSPDLKSWMAAKRRDADWCFGVCVIAMSPLLAVVCIGLFGSGM